MQLSKEVANHGQLGSAMEAEDKTLSQNLEDLVKDMGKEVFEVF